jgi:O-antigen/teichoic acid export membrane protein
MGIIRKQAVFSTVVSYIGVVVGFTTSAILMPTYFSTDQLGLVKLIVASVGLISSIFSLGVGQLLYRGYSSFKNEPEKQQNLFYFALRLAVLGGLLSLPFFWFFRDELLNTSEKTIGFNKTEIFVISVFLAVVAKIIYNAIFGYIRMLGKIIIDAFIQNIIFKMGTLILVLLYIFGLISFTSFVYGQIFLFLLFPFVAILFLRWRKKTPIRKRKVLFSKPEKKELYRLSLFGSLGTIGGALYLFLDTFMVNFYLGESAVGIYGTMYLFGVIVSVPARSLKNISVSFVSDALVDGKIDEVKQIYRKGSNTLIVIGGLLFLGILGNVYSIYGFLPKAFYDTFWVILFIGLAQLIDMVTSVNIEILAASKYYKLNTYFVFLSIVVAVFFNVILIPIYGISGAAFGTLLAILLNNSIRCYTIWRYYKISPFSINTAKAILVIIGVYFLIYLIPNVENHLLNLLIKGFLIVLIYIPIVYFLKISTELNNWLNLILSRFAKRFN